ncbi:heterokaryon incompatibility protein [Colletotrichum plurivorum]|uniref:Heterokaryon incompatibility protein n=1 Tax=Colletotrichum plurivorum TaxID=2175906 RepID=A0A8H6KWG0_9PEZI|nr:heterokaryon incompatibility protein [Colletotrichum plurivorum]
MTDTKYQYQALSAVDSVRLLSISRADDHPYGMRLSLTEVHLDDDPSFAALSYTWQLPEYIDHRERTESGTGNEFDVACDGKLMSISENLFDFLRMALRARDGGDLGARSSLTPKVAGILGSMPLWIDAFCINQADADEKRHQVLLMHRIYSSARKVIVWLGPAQPHPDVVWIHDKFTPILAKLMKKRPDFVEMRLRPDPFCRSQPVIDELGQDVCSRWAAAWQPFEKFLHRQRWFDRGWVVQEVALADPADVYVLCGGPAFSWKRLTALSQFLHEISWSTSLGENPFPSFDFGKDSFCPPVLPPAAYRSNFDLETDVGDRIRKINEIRSTLGDVIQQTGLAADCEEKWFFCANFLVTSLRSSRFGDDRDHIHGCLGMMSMVLPHDFQIPIIPDYERHVVEIFTSTAGLFLQKTPLLLELSRVESRSARRCRELPSWVPDYCVPFDQNRSKSTTKLSINKHMDMSLEALRREQRDMWGNHVRVPVVSGSELVLHGTIVGFLSIVLKPRLIHTLEVSDLGDILYLITADRESHQRTDGAFWDAMGLRLIGMYLSRPRDEISPEVESECREFLESLRMRTKGGGPPRDGSTMVLYKSLMKPEYKDPAIIAEVTSRSLFLTWDGQLGLGPGEAEQGDEVWLVEGARKPFVLRRVDAELRPEDGITGAFELVGDADIRGFEALAPNWTAPEQRHLYSKIKLV